MPDTSTSVVGAYSGTDPYDSFVSVLKWITETQAKIPQVNQAMREEAFNTDPLLKGSVTEFMKNYLLSGGHVVTTDNKIYEKQIKEIEQALAKIDPIGVFREDFVDFYITKGHAYRRIHRDTAGKIEYLSPIDSSLINTYADQWDPRIRAYHQDILVKNSWNTTTTPTRYNSWWIPGVEAGRSWAAGVDTMDPFGVKAAFDALAGKYGITDTQNLRISSSSDIMAMDRVGIDDPAPIDAIILAIWLKRMILVQSPNMIFRVLSPILQLKRGLVYKETDDLGNEKIITTVPQEPASELATINPELYAQMSAEYSSYHAQLKTDCDTLLGCLKTGGIYGSGPVDEVNVIESGRNLTHVFVRETIALLNEEIGQGIGFPVALLTATGSELATSRVIESVLQKNLSGIKRQYEKQIEWIIRELFGDTLPLDEMEIEYVLDSPDIKDLLTEAQAKNTDADTLLKLKAFGMSLADAQAMADEIMDTDILELSNYNKEVEQPNPFQPMQSAAVDLNPSPLTGEELDKEIKKGYLDAMKKIYNIIDEEVVE